VHKRFTGFALGLVVGKQDESHCAEYIYQDWNKKVSDTLP